MGIKARAGVRELYRRAGVLLPPCTLRTLYAFAPVGLGKCHPERRAKPAVEPVGRRRASGSLPPCTQGSHYGKSLTLRLPCCKFSQNAIQRAFCRYGDTENSVGLWRCTVGRRRSGASRRYICFAGKANSICASHSIYCYAIRYVDTSVSTRRVEARLSL